MSRVSLLKQQASKVACRQQRLIALSRQERTRTPKPDGRFITNQAELVQGKEHDRLQILRLGQLDFLSPGRRGIADTHKKASLQAREASRFAVLNGPFRLVKVADESVGKALRFQAIEVSRAE
jgi:hypothetical protein